MPANVDELIAQLRSDGLRVTTARRLVLAALMRLPDHPTAEELLSAVREVAPEVHESTVYRNLEELERAGMVVHSHLGHGAATYQLAGRAHGHLVCERCGTDFEVPSEAVDAFSAQVLRRVAFELRPYHFAVPGVCSSCAAAPA